MTRRDPAWLEQELSKRKAWPKGAAIAHAPDGTIDGAELVLVATAPPAKRKSARPPRPLERDILATVVELMNLHPKVAWARRMNVGMFKVQDASGERWVRAAFKGCSDVVGQLRDGRFLAVECKRPREQPTPEQQAFIDHVRRHHGVAFVARSIDDVTAALAIV